jgi:hypothetical protein
MLFMYRSGSSSGAPVSYWNDASPATLARGSGAPTSPRKNDRPRGPLASCLSISAYASSREPVVIL